MAGNDTNSVQTGTTDGHNTGQIQSVDEALICHGCGLVSHYVHDTTHLCGDCWTRRNKWQGGGPLRVVTPSMTYHETPLCPAVQQASEWRYYRDETCMYADLSGDMDKCVRCHAYGVYGFDEYAGDEDRHVVVGHA